VVAVAEAGLGLARVPSFVAGEALRSGAIRAVLQASASKKGEPARTGATIRAGTVVCPGDACGKAGSLDGRDPALWRLSPPPCLHLLKRQRAGEVLGELDRIEGRRIG
jgi:hypothetical protein